MNSQDENNWEFVKFKDSNSPTLEWGYATNTPSEGEGNALRISSSQSTNFCLYQEVILTEGTTYNFNAAYRLINFNECWNEYYITETEPFEGMDDISNDNGSILGAINSWWHPSNVDNGNVKTHGIDVNSYTATKSGTFYFVMKFGTQSAIDCTVDNIQLTKSSSTIGVYPNNPTITLNQQQFNILSLNNSLIDYNDQPNIFNNLAQTAGKNAIWEKQTKLGQSLEYHFNEGEGLLGDGNPSAKMRIRSKKWTHIILQEQSAKPRTNFEAFNPKNS